MIKCKPRRILFLCAALDWLGIIGLSFLIEANNKSLPFFSSLNGSFSGFYLFFSWILGSYTVLRWPWLRLRPILLRLFLSSTLTLVALICAEWIGGASTGFIFVEQKASLIFLSLLTLWSLGLRLYLRRFLRDEYKARWHLLAEPQYASKIQEEWKRHANIPPLPGLNDQAPMYGVAIWPSQAECAPQHVQRVQSLSSLGVPIKFVHELAEQQLERLPPALLPEEWMSIQQIPWYNCFSVQRQLKRTADVIISIVLLVLTLPLLAVVAILIWLEDRGPVFYFQWRSGLMGIPFRLIKLRTMRSSSSYSTSGLNADFAWTQPGDHRITRIGYLLRRTRIDELPQLINVLKGEMSLIGPRPERPELEQQLEESIPHYRKRHWMPPGLSGWAQVCSSYASSLAESELKLSYDLFYLRNWSTTLDLLILGKTIKTILKASGR